MRSASRRVAALSTGLLVTSLLGAFPAAAQPASMCETISIAELDGLSTLAYGSATADFTGCTYSPAGGGDHELRVNLAPVDGVKWLPEAFPGGELYTVGERFAYFIDGSLFLQLIDGTVAIEPTLGASADVDAKDYATAIAEVALPQLDAFVTARVELLSADEPGGEPTLCDLLGKDELNALSPLQFGDPPGFAANETSCRYDSSPLQQGFHGLNIGLTAPGEPSFAINSAKFGGAEEIEVAGYPAYLTTEALIVDIDGRVLTVRPGLNDSPPAEGMDLGQYATTIATTIIANLASME